MRNALFFVLLLLAGCTKFGKNVTVKGRVVNPINGEGVSDIRVFMYKATATSLPADYKTVKEVYTDSDGSFELNKLGLSKYYVKCDVPGDYYLIGWEQKDGISLFDKYTLSVKKGKTMHADFYVVPYGNLQININNTSCFDSSDELKIFRTHSIVGFYDNVPNPAIYTGCVNQTGNMNKAPMGWYKYNGTVTKNGIVTPKKDSIYLNGGETKIWNINY
jgi:hypothetical protein